MTPGQLRRVAEDVAAQPCDVRFLPSFFDLCGLLQRRYGALTSCFSHRGSSRRVSAVTCVGRGRSTSALPPHNPFVQPDFLRPQLHFLPVRPSPTSSRLVRLVLTICPPTATRGFSPASAELDSLNNRILHSVPSSTPSHFLLRLQRFVSPLSRTRRFRQLFMNVKESAVEATLQSFPAPESTPHLSRSPLPTSNFNLLFLLPRQHSTLYTPSTPFRSFISCPTAPLPPSPRSAEQRRSSLPAKTTPSSSSRYVGTTSLPALSTLEKYGRVA